MRDQNHDLDRFIDRAAEELVGREPSRMMTRAVMERVRAAGRPGFKVLGSGFWVLGSRFWVVGSAIAMLIVAILVMNREGPPSRTVPRVTSGETATAQNGVTDRAAVPEMAPERLTPSSSDVVEPFGVAATTATSVDEPDMPPGDPLAVEPLEEPPLEVTRIEIGAVAIDELEIEPLVIEPLSASND